MEIDMTGLPAFGNSERGYVGWIPGWDYLSGKDRYDTNIIFKDWTEFLVGFGDTDTEYNTIVNFYFSEDTNEDGKNTLRLNMWMLHPRKGASRAIIVETVPVEELPKVKHYLKMHYEQVKVWFNWLEN